MNEKDNNNNDVADFEPIDTAETERKVAMGKDDKSLPAGLMEDEVRVLQGISDDVKSQANGQGPLDQPIVERSYTERQFAGDTMSPIPEPQQTAQVIDPGANIGNSTTPPIAEVKKNIAQDLLKDKAYAAEVLGEKENPKTGGNPATQTMTNKERQQNLELTATTVVSYYESFWNWIAGWLTISDNKLIKRQNEGKTPSDWAVLYDSTTGEVMTLREFVQETNKRITEACQTDPEFKRHFHALLMAELDRRNWILSTQQNIIAYVGKDVLSKGQRLFAIHLNMKQVLDQVDKEFEDKRKYGFVSAREAYNLRNFSTFTQQTPAQPAPATAPQANTNTETISIPKEEPAVAETVIAAPAETKFEEPAD